MFKSIWLKITAALSIVIAGLVTYIKFLSNKNKKLSDENKGHEKKEEIREGTKEAKEEILKDEAETVKSKLKIKPTNTRRERIKRMRNNNKLS